MVKVTIEEVWEDDILAKDIFNKWGLKLLAAGMLLTENYKQGLRKHHVNSVWVLRSTVQ